MLPGLLRLHLLLYYHMLCCIKYNVIYTVSTKSLIQHFLQIPLLIKMEIKIVWSGKRKLHVDVWSIAIFKLFFSNSVTYNFVTHGYL